MTTNVIRKRGVDIEVSYVGLKLNNKTDADILSAIGDVDRRHNELKRLIRIGLAEESKL